jgi:hypothetical protein
MKNHLYCSVEGVSAQARQILDPYEVVNKTGSKVRAAIILLRMRANGRMPHVPLQSGVLGCLERTDFENANIQYRKDILASDPTNTALKIGGILGQRRTFCYSQLFCVCICSENRNETFIYPFNVERPGKSMKYQIPI